METSVRLFGHTRSDKKMEVASLSYLQGYFLGQRGWTSQDSRGDLDVVSLPYQWFQFPFCLSPLTALIIINLQSVLGRPFSGDFWIEKGVSQPIV